MNNEKEESEVVELLKTVISNQKFINNELSELKKMIEREHKELWNHITLKNM